MRDKKVWIGLIALVGIIAPFSNAANAAENNFLKKTALEKRVAVKTAFLVSKAKIFKKYENASNLSDKDLFILLKAVGFKGQDLKEAWAVAKKESNGQPIRFNGNTKTGDSSYGLFQINMIRDLGPERRAKFNLRTNSDLLNPVINAKIAYHMSNGGRNWSAWHGITTRTKMWMSKFHFKI